jgi:hypothetical protein
MNLATGRRKLAGYCFVASIEHSKRYVLFSTGVYFLINQNLRQSSDQEIREKGFFSHSEALLQA